MEGLRVTTSRGASLPADAASIVKEGGDETTMSGRTADAREARDEPRYRHVLKLYVAHPAWPAERITRGLGEEPTYAWNVGETARIGDRLIEGRKRHQTVWCIREWREGKRHFSHELEELCTKLHSKKNFVDEIRRTNGKIIIIFELSGQENIGDVISPEQLSRAADLGVGIGIEVFPTLS
jgi:hypothetical protein